MDAVLAGEDPIASLLYMMADELGPAASEHYRCVKLNVPTTAALLKRQDLPSNCEQLECDPSLLEEITGNYVIVKQILSSLSWQEKLICKSVSSMWRSAVNALKKEQIGPSDFVVSLRLSHIRSGVALLQSESFYTEPMVVLAFANVAGVTVTCKCKAMVPCPCDPPCDKDHNLLNVVQNRTMVPKSCMLAVKALYTAFLPLPHTITNFQSICQNFGRTKAFIGGVYIPMLPNVEFQVINIKSVADIKGHFIQTMDELAETRYIKGALVFVNGSFILQSVDDIVFLNYFRELQPDVPYALGGCIVEDTLTNSDDMNNLIEGINTGKDVVSVNLITIGVFSIPKNFDGGCNFDMFSLILESSDWSKAKMQSAINEFSKKVPHFEHSVAIKMSCVGRDSKHDYEQNFFRAAFPNTRIVGCYGNGELGINLPERKNTSLIISSAKRQRADPSVFGLMYSYATVFVYIGWGKIRKPAKPT